MDADAAAAQPRRVDPGRLAIFLDQPPGRLAVEVPPLKPLPSGVIGRKSGPSRSSLMPARVDVGQDRPGGVEQDLPPLPVAFLGDVEVMIDAVGLQVADAGPGHRREKLHG